MSANDIIERNANCARQLLEAGAEIERLRRELAQLRSQAGDGIELQEAEQRGFERGRAYQQLAQEKP